MERMRSYLLLLLLAVHLGCLAQADSLITISGVVKDRQTGREMPFASVTAGKVGTVTNEDGAFTLKVRRGTKHVVVSSVGYRSQRVAVAADEITVRMVPSAVLLSEVIIRADDPEAVLRAAIAKIPDNYSKEAERFGGFYRETVQKRRRFIDVAEAVIDMYKTDYSRLYISRDGVKIAKGRHLMTSKAADTLGVKIKGGPVLPIMLDIVKNKDFLFSDESLDDYIIGMSAPEKADDRLQYVVTLTPKQGRDYALFFGRVFVDQERLSITRVELSLDVSDRDKATRFMLVKKPAGLRFRPRELTLEVNYKTQDNVTRIQYIRNVFRFNCDWKRRLFHSPYSVVSEMVVTDRGEGLAQPIPRKEKFSQWEALYDKIEYFEDPDFWGNYNIIEPTESLEKAVRKLRKMRKG